MQCNCRVYVSDVTETQELIVNQGKVCSLYIDSKWEVVALYSNETQYRNV